MGKKEDIGETCDYGGCDKPAVAGLNHEGKHWFCEYHFDELNP